MNAMFHRHPPMPQTDNSFRHLEAGSVMSNHTPANRRRCLGAAVLLCLALLPGFAAADLDGEVQTLKQELMELNRDLFLLEEELLAPSDTQVAIFVSLDTGELFALDSVQISLDGSVVASYLYTPREVEALRRGGVQRIYLGNLKSGEHELVAYFTGKGPHERDYRRGATVRFTKQLGPKYLELKIVDSAGKQQPDFAVKEWD